MNCLLWIKKTMPSCAYYTLLNPVKGMLSSLEEDKASFILSLSNLTGSHEKKTFNPQFRSSHVALNDFGLFPEIKSTLEVQRATHREQAARVPCSVGFPQKGVLGVFYAMATSLQ